METRHLECFLAIVDNGSFTKAAGALRLSQPSLSQTIKALERDLGLPLFHRVGRRALLSDAGLRLIEPARLVLRDMDAVRQLQSSLQANVVGVVDIAVSPSASVGPLPSLVEVLQARHSDVIVRVHHAFTATDGIDRVRTARCELALVASDAPIDGRGLESILLEEPEFVVIAPAGTGAGSGPLSRNQLAGWRFVVGQPGTRMRELFDSIVAAGIDVKAVVEAGSREGILPLVARGIGASLMPEPWSALATLVGAEVFRLDPPERYRLWLVHRASRLTPAAAAMRSAAIGYAQEDRTRLQHTE